VNKLDAKRARFTGRSYLNRLAPPSRATAPPSIFINVDFPAPFSPIRATISPVPTDKLT
jgi:hypothetical protein